MISRTMTIACLATACCTTGYAAELKLWYDKPAVRWEQEALPIGNGRLGCMIFGGMQKEHIQFNEDSHR